MKFQKTLLILSASAMLGGQSSPQTSRWPSHFLALLPAALLPFPRGISSRCDWSLFDVR
jgi:hypothetical protein